MSSTITSLATKTEDDSEYHDDDVPLPGFRFHPTDEELVGFYLRRKVEKKPIKFELIKQADIYKYDPWDLPKSSNNGEKEWYFFCQRGRKYKNSVRPNRVTGSGFWKATGIDKPIYSSSNGGEARNSRVIGLKKSLVYYRGSAGKGAKTEWMMHEFRLPSASHDKSTTTKKPAMDANTVDHEAEVWTLCRILKRDVSCNKRYVPDWREFAAKKNISTGGSISIMNPKIPDGASESCSMDDSNNCDGQSSYISFNNAPSSSMMAMIDIRHVQDLPHQHFETKPYCGNISNIYATHHQQFSGGNLSPSPSPEAARAAAIFPSSACNDVNELLMHADWEELRNILDCAAAAAATSAHYNPFSACK